MKILSIVLRILLILLLLTPILGASGVLPAPTADLYTPEGWAFISALMNSGYMMWLLALTCAVCVVLLAIGQTALAAVVLAPFTVNVMAFHWFLEGGPFHVSASLAYILFALNLFFLWVNRNKYKVLWS